MVNEEEQLGDRIKNIRQSLNLSLTEFAARLGSRAPKISEIENNKYKPKFDVMRRLAIIYNANLYYLFFGEGDMFQDAGQAFFNQFSLDEADFCGDDLEFFHYFSSSRICRHEVMAFFRKLLVKDKELFDREIKKRRSTSS